MVKLLLKTAKQVRPLACGESSAAGGFPAVGDWRSRWGVSPVEQSGRQRKAAHRMQVLIYMLLLSVAPDSRCKNLIPEGRLVYPDGVVDIPSSDVDSQFKELFRKTVAIISNSQPARMAPSFWECRFCDIPAKYCPAKIDSEPPTESVDRDLF